MPEAHRNMKPVEQSLGGSIVEIPVTQHILAPIGNDRQCGTIPNAFLAEKSVYAPSGKMDLPSDKTTRRHPRSRSGALPWHRTNVTPYRIDHCCGCSQSPARRPADEYRQLDGHDPNWVGRFLRR